MRPNTLRLPAVALALFAPALASAEQSAFVWFGCGASSCVPNTDFQYNANGSTNTVTRLSLGRYEVDLPATAAPGGNAQVTAQGVASNHCKVESWSALSTTQRVFVRCYTAAGALVDSGFDVSYQNNEDLATGSKPAAYLWADQMSAASYTPHLTYSWNSGGNNNTITRTGVGAYNVTLGGVASGGNAQVTAYGSDAKRCKAASISASRVSTVVAVRCFNGAAAADSRFTLSYFKGTTMANAPTGGNLGVSFTANQTASVIPYVPGSLFQNVGYGAVVTKIAQGIYDTHLSGVDGTMTSDVLVTATSTANTFCNVDDWWSDGAGGTDARVRCFTSAGGSTDAAFNLLYQTGTRAPNLTAATALVNQATVDARGMVVAAVKNGTLVYSQAVGMANDNVPASTTVPWQLASLSKQFTNTAALQMVNAGLLDPDAPADDVMDLEVENPYFYGVPTTLRHFASHTSGAHAGVCTVSTWNGWDPSADLYSVLEGCLHPGGLTDLSIWANNAPGSQYEYSNIGSAVPARMVELASGVDFNTYTQQNIFQPLGMNTAGWFASSFNLSAVAAGFYTPAGSPTNETGVSPYPAGNLRASALDVSRFLIMWTSDGAAFGQQILTPGTVAASTTAQFPGSPGTAGMGFFWGPWSNPLSGRAVWAQGGVLAGVCNRLDIDPATRTGLVILTNGPCTAGNSNSINAVENAVLQALDAM